MAIVRPVDGRRLRLALFLSGIVKHDESDAANLCLVRSRAQSGSSSLAAQKTPDCTSWHTHRTLLHNLGQSPETTMVKSWEMTDKRHLGSLRYDVESAVRQASPPGSVARPIPATRRCPFSGRTKALTAWFRPDEVPSLANYSIRRLLLRVVQQPSFSSLLIVEHVLTRCLGCRQLNAEHRAAEEFRIANPLQRPVWPQLEYVKPCVCPTLSRIPH